MHNANSSTCASSELFAWQSPGERLKPPEGSLEMEEDDCPKIVGEQKSRLNASDCFFG